jgi:hypothetical protein
MNEKNEKIETLILLLCKIPQLSKVRRACSELGFDENELDIAIAEARRQLTIAADYHRDEEIGKSIIRYEDIYHQAYKDKSYKLALSAEKARVALLGLASAEKLEVTETSAATEFSETQSELIEIRNHLEPLELAPVGASLSELARLAALKITEK